MCFHVWANLFRFTKPSHWAPCSIYCMWKVKKCCEATHTHKRKSEREKLRQTPFPLSPYFLFEQQYPRLCAGHNTGNTLDCVQAECDIRDYGKKVHNLEIEFDETNDKLQKAIGRKATGKQLCRLLSHRIFPKKADIRVFWSLKHRPKLKPDPIGVGKTGFALSYQTT